MSNDDHLSISICDGFDYWIIQLLELVIIGSSKHVRNFTIFLYCRGMERFSTIELNQVFLGNLDYSYGLVLLSLYSSRLVDTSFLLLQLPVYL